MVVGFVLEASLLSVGHQHGKNNFWKSSWLRKEIVSHVQGFTRPYKNKQGYLFWPAGATKKLTITMTISDESHWSMSQRWLLLFHSHTPCLGRKCLDWRGHSCSSSEVTTALVSFGLQDLAGDPWSLASYQEPSQRDEIPPSGHRTLQNLVSLKGRPLSIVNESKLNHKGPLHSGQIFQLEIKSYLRLTGCDGRKW